MDNTDAIAQHLREHADKLRPSIAALDEAQRVLAGAEEALAALQRQVTDNAQQSLDLTERIASEHQRRLASVVDINERAAAQAAENELKAKLHALAEEAVVLDEAVRRAKQRRDEAAAVAAIARRTLLHGIGQELGPLLEEQIRGLFDSFVVLLQYLRSETGARNFTPTALARTGVEISSEVKGYTIRTGKLATKADALRAHASVEAWVQSLLSELRSADAA